MNLVCLHEDYKSLARLARTGVDRYRLDYCHALYGKVSNSLGANKLRKYGTGATRDDKQGKLVYEAFLHPVVLKRYAEFMHENRIQADGQLREGDNWQKGIPEKDYVDSLLRHVWDIWFWNSGDYEEMTEDYETACCAAMFNTMGLLYEVLVKRGRINRKDFSEKSLYCGSDSG